MKADQHEFSTPMPHNVQHGGEIVHSYQVRLNGIGVGDASVIVEGLYYRITSKCRLPDTGIFRLIVLTENNKTDLGIFVPQENYFIVDKRIPARKIGDGEFEFYITDSDDVITNIVPVYYDMPFEYIARLSGAYLQADGKKFRILLNNNSSIDTGNVL